ncbi:hypothetical protein [Tunturiibacter gelidiferens]|uniref:Apea-like HEPN domain-containing protein n=1 Tax=Tunturiibacter gelidiferens TaxID=3069689 RepID=A0AAU7Z2K2_9BACT
MNLEVRRFGGKITSQEVLKMFTHNFALHEKGLKESFESLEKYRLVINPHYRHRRMMTYFEGELRKIKVKDIDVPQSIVVKKGDSDKHAKDIDRYMKQMEHQNCIATALVMECAYTAESYLNMLIAVLRNKTLLENRVILQEALRETWKDKLLRLPLHCREIAKTPRETDQPVRDIESVFRLRNKIAHSYPDPEDLCSAEIWFDDRIPLLPRTESYIPYQCGVDSILPRRQEALACPPKVIAFIVYLQSLLNEKVREEITFFSESNPVGFSDKTGNFGIPFGKSLTMAVFGG